MKIYAIIISVNSPDLKPLFCIRESSSCCYNRSPYGDTGILILVISVLHEFKHRITIDSTSAKKGKNVLLGTIELTEEYYLALVRTHALSGNDYKSSFLKRGKEKMLADY